MSQNKHKLLAFTLVIALLFGGCSAAPAQSNSETTDISQEVQTNNVFMNATVHLKTFSMNPTDPYGKQGSYKYIDIDKESAKSTSAEDFAIFLKNVVSKADDNWFTIDFGDGTGIVFPGCEWEMGTYCKLQPEGMQGETIGYLKVVDRDNYIVEYQAK